MEDAVEAKRRYRKKPLAVFEHGTRIYAPTPDAPRYRVVAADTTGSRIFLKLRTEDDARAKARELEAYLASATPVRGPDEVRTVAALADRYRESLSTRSARYRERQEGLLRKWILPSLGDTLVSDWTPAHSEQILAHARTHLSSATVQSLGSCMRSLVTFAHKSRWLPRDIDPMWLVSYSPKAEYQGQAIGFVPRDALPTDDECEKLFQALEDHDQHRWALAMRLKHRSGTRWGELIALRPVDIDFEPNRVVRIERAVEQTSGNRSIKTTKNHHKRWTFFPASLAEPLRDHVAHVARAEGPEALLFPSPRGGPADRGVFRRTWVRAARAAGWPMKTPTAARWHPHDLRHVAACWMLFDVHIEPATVAMMLGHANPAFTMARYVGVRTDAERRVNDLTAGL
jgi:integrase